MASRTEQLFEASFDNVDFLVPSESAKRGQKVAVHEYPNSDKRFAEPLGKIPPIIELTAIVHGSDFAQRRLDLENALEKTGIKVLIHPVYGSLDVQVGEFSSSSSQREVGKITFNITFYVSDSEILPTKIATVISADDAREAINNKLESSYVDPLDADALLSVSDVALDFLDKILDSQQEVFQELDSTTSELNQTINSARNNIYKVMQTASGMRNMIENTINTFLQLKEDPSTLALAWKNLTSFGTYGEKTGSAQFYDGGVVVDDSGRELEGRPLPPGPTDTVPREDKANNKDVVSDATRLTGFSSYMESVGNTTFESESDLQDSLDFIDDRIKKLVVENETTDGIVSIANDPDVRRELLALRVATKEALNTQRSNVWSVVEKNQGKTTMSIFAHRNYGDLETLDTLIGLNPEVNVANFNETINAVSE